MEILRAEFCLMMLFMKLVSELSFLCVRFSFLLDQLVTKALNIQGTELIRSKLVFFDVMMFNKSIFLDHVPIFI